MYESLKIMGLRRGAYWSSYILMQGLLVIFQSLILTGCIIVPYADEVGNYFNFRTDQFGHSSISGLFMAFILLGMSFCGLATVLSTLFTDSKLAAQVGPVIMYLPMAISVLLAVQSTIPLGHM